MNFNSWQFLVFFPVIGVLYFVITMQVRKNAVSQVFLLGASLFFYLCWNPAYIALILFSVLVTWVSGLLMTNTSARNKKLILGASLALNLGVLFFFKYYNFFTGTVNMLFATLNHGMETRLPALNVLLPVGISFYTFQALGYSIDVYRGTVAAERNFLTYALFVTFFPQLVAGPIERTGNLIPQFKADYSFDYDRVTSGLKLAAWGMFKKVVIADRVAMYVNAVYGDPGVYPACAVLLATIFFTVQIYCDFSGYSDIAIGAARVLGFNLMTNFRTPYFSRSISEFWRRWHISLSAWLKDYVYIPLGGNRKGAARQRFNLLITFLLSGLWHGAAWHFVLWGLLHGVFQVIERSTAAFRSTLKRTIGLQEESRFTKFLELCITFALVCFAWICFRANTIRDALLIFTKLTTLPSEITGYIRQLPHTGVMGTIRTALQLGNDVAHPIEKFGISATGLSFISIVILFLSDLWTRMAPGTTRIMRLPLVVRWAGYYALMLVIVLSWSTDSSEFIYFTF
jgi:D-alanyl-lipoteichoic acid acyltransferase DltB (MBOAT superfamily)